MHKEQLTKELVGAEVVNLQKGKGIITSAEAGMDNVLIDVQFANDKVTYSVIVAAEKRVLVFSDEKYIKVLSELKDIYEEVRRKKSEMTLPKFSRNKDITDIIEQFKSNQSITKHLIQAFKKPEFEDDLFKLGSTLLVRKLDGYRLSTDELQLIIIFLSYIALKEYDGDLHGKIYSNVSNYCNKHVDNSAVMHAVYDVINSLDLRAKVRYPDKKSYVAVPISLACVPHYRVGQLFRIAYDIYKKKLLFDEDVTDLQIKEKIKETLSDLKRKNYITETAEETIRGTEYLMSKYTQACIYSEYNIEALIDILAHEIRLIINYLTKQEDAYIVLEYYKAGFSEWIASFENDSFERAVYIKNRLLSSPSLLMNSKREIYLKTGAYCMDDTFDPYKVSICIYNNEVLVGKYKFDEPGDIEYNDEAIGGYKINSKKLLLTATSSPIGKLQYKIFCDDRLLYDSQERLYREALFFCAKDGTEAKPGTDHVGEEVIVISKTDNSDNYGDKLTIISKYEQYLVSQITIENGDPYVIDGNPYIFRKVKEIEFFGYQVPWIRFVSMEKQQYPIYKNIAVLLPASCDKEDVQVELDGDIIDYYSKTYRIYKYSQNSDGTFVYLVKVLNVESGYHQITFKNVITNKYIGKNKLAFVFDRELCKENQFFSADGQSFNLCSSFLRDKISISYPYGTTLVKERAYVKNLGHGELNLLPSAPSYSLDGTIWLDVYKPLLLYDIPTEQRFIYVCGPERMSIFYASEKGKRERLDFEKTEINTYKIPLSYLRSLNDRKGHICFDYGNSSKLLRIYRLPWIKSIECVPTDDGKAYHASATFDASNRMWMVIKTNHEEVLLEREINSGELVRIDRHLVDANVRFISIGIHSQGASLFCKYNTVPIKSIKYTIPYDVTINEKTNICYNIEQKNIAVTVFFTGPEQIRLRVYPTGLDNLLLLEKLVKSGDAFTIDVGHELFGSYHLIFESVGDTLCRINKPIFKIKAFSRYLRKTFYIDQFILENGLVKNVTGFHFKFNERYLLIDNSLYAVGEIIKYMNSRTQQEALLKMSLIPSQDGVFEVFKYKDSQTRNPILKRYLIKDMALEKIKINTRIEL